jgi:hypothetical protein
MSLLTPRRALVAVLALCAALPAVASADPVTYTGASSTSVTLAHLDLAPRESFAVTGAGYSPGSWVIFRFDAMGATSTGASGTASGPDVAPTQQSGWPTFLVDAGGHFTGTITMPETVTTAGEPAAGPNVGRHFFQALAGTFPAPGGWTASTIRAYIDLAAQTARVTGGAVVPGGSATFALAGFVKTAGGGQQVAISLDGTTPLGCVAADADGTKTSTIAIPYGTSTGAHTLQFDAGAGCPGASAAEAPTRAAAAALTVDPSPAAAVTLGASSVVAGDAVTVSGTSFDASAAVTVDLDGTPIPASLTTTAGGTFSGSVTIPTATTAGSHTLGFTTGSRTASGPLAVTAPSTGGGGGGAADVVVTTPTVAQGGAVGVRITGFVKAAGGGQLVGVRIDDSRTLAGCVATDSSGNATASIPVPDGLAAGEHTIRFLAGTACISGGPQVEPDPRSMTRTFVLVGDPAATTTAAPTDSGAAASTDGGAANGATGTGGGTATAAPATAALSVGKTLKATKAGSVKLAVKLSGAAKGTVAMRTAAKVKVGKQKRFVTLVAKRAWTVSAPGTATLTLKLTGEGRRLLAKHHTLRARVTVVDAAGHASSKVVTLR